MKGPRRRRVFAAVSTATRSTPAQIAHGPMRGLVFAGGENAGYALGASEPAVQQAMVDHLQAGDVFYDVGANAGFLALLGAKLVGPSGHVYCFEPSPTVIPTLRRNLDQNGFSNYDVIEAAVGDEPGTAHLAIGRGELHASLTSDASSGISVRVLTLDDLGLPAPALVKIDVEGAESSVLRGMQKLLRDHRPRLVVEIHGAQREPVESILREAEYTIEVLNDDGMTHLLASAA